MDTLAFANLLLDVASIINTVAVLWLLRSVIQNRKMLKGFSVVGSFLTFFSILIFEFAYHLVGNLIGFAVGWVTVAFWFIVFIYSLEQKIKGSKKQKQIVAP